MTIPKHLKNSYLTILLHGSLTFLAMAQTNDALDQSRENLRLWLETSQKNQEEANSWKNDKEVLTNYKEGLLVQKETYLKQIADAKARAAAADQGSSDKISQRDQFILAEKNLSTYLRRMEEDFAKTLPMLPSPIVKFAKINVGIETLKKNLALPADKQTDDVGKRLANLTEIIAEVEKFQQTITVSKELHKNSAGQEYDMQVAYLGMAAAYAVNEDASFAMVAGPTPTGWKFVERNDLAKDISKFIITATTEKDVSLTNLPLPTP